MGRPERSILLLGGARSGKSRLALELVEKSGLSPLFCATSLPVDWEMEARILRHQAERPPHFETVEVPLGFSPLWEKDLRRRALLLDCVSLLVSNVLLEEEEEERSYGRICREFETLFSRQKRDGFLLVLVSNEVGMGVVPEYPLGRTYRDLLGRVNQWLAARVEAVYFVVAGIPWRVK
ncbi:MAG: bifunctional adenosylcobinamide kinase/adenosylcobinamide-phosphate guanylyltransferase [Candidatus Caldatribacteriaceae bacterium]